MEIGCFDQMKLKKNKCKTFIYITITYSFPSVFFEILTHFNNIFMDKKNLNSFEKGSMLEKMKRLLYFN